MTIRSLGDMQLSLYYKTNEKDLFEIKNEISDYLYETLRIEIEKDRLEDTQRFYEGIQNVERSIPPETMDEFMRLFIIKEGLDREIKIRQKNMLKDIGIITPSIWVLEIMEKTQGNHFHIFSDMIKHIQMDKKDEINQLLKKKIHTIKPLVEMEKKLKMKLITILADNVGPYAN